MKKLPMSHKLWLITLLLSLTAASAIGNYLFKCNNGLDWDGFCRQHYNGYRQPSCSARSNQVTSGCKGSEFTGCLALEQSSSALRPSARIVSCQQCLCFLSNSACNLPAQNRQTGMATEVCR